MAQTKYLENIKQVMLLKGSTRGLIHIHSLSQSLAYSLTHSLTHSLLYYYIQIPGFVKVDRYVCGGCNDFKIVVKLTMDKFDVSDHRNVVCMHRAIR